MSDSWHCSFFVPRLSFASPAPAPLRLALDTTGALLRKGVGLSYRLRQLFFEPSHLLVGRLLCQLLRDGRQLLLGALCRARWKERRERARCGERCLEFLVERDGEKRGGEEGQDVTARVDRLSFAR